MQFTYFVSEPLPHCAVQEVWLVKGSASNPSSDKLLQSTFSVDGLSWHPNEGVSSSYALSLGYSHNCRHFLFCLAVLCDLCCQPKQFTDSPLLPMEYETVFQWEWAMLAPFWWQGHAGKLLTKDSPVTWVFYNRDFLNTQWLKCRFGDCPIHEDVGI